MRVLRAEASSTTTRDGELPSFDALLEFAGGADQIETLYKKLFQRANNILKYVRVNKTSEAEDLTQKVLQKIVAGGYKDYRKDKGELLGWLFSITLNLHRDWVRAHKLEYVQMTAPSQIPDFNLITYKLESVQDSPLTTLLRQEQAEFVRGCIDCLPLKLRTPLYLRDIEEFTYKEIQNKLGLTVGTVKCRIRSGRIELAEIIKGRLPQNSPFYSAAHRQ